MLISLIMQIAQSMQISIRHFLTPQTMYITFPLKNLAVKNIFGLVCLASGLVSNIGLRPAPFCCKRGRYVKVFDLI